MTSGLLARQLRRQNVWRWHRSVTAPRHIDVHGGGTLGAGTGDVPVGPPADHPWALLSSGFTGGGSLASGGATPNTVAVLAAQARGGAGLPSPGGLPHPLSPETRPSSGRQGWAGLAVGRRVEVTMSSGSMATCRCSVASALAGRVSRGARGDEGRAADVDGIVPLGVVLDVVGDKTAVDANLGRTLSQVFQGVAR